MYFTVKWPTFCFWILLLKSSPSALNPLSKVSEITFMLIRCFKMLFTFRKGWISGSESLCDLLSEEALIIGFNQSRGMEEILIVEKMKVGWYRRTKKLPWLILSTFWGLYSLVRLNKVRKIKVKNVATNFWVEITTSELLLWLTACQNLGGFSHGAL